MDQPFQQTLTVRRLTLEHPLRWLRAGWRDFLRSWPVGLAHGAAVALFALLVLVVAGDHFWLLTGAFSGFLLVAPVVAVGLYAVSRELGSGGPGGFRAVVDPQRLRGDAGSHARGGETPFAPRLSRH